MPRQIKEIAKEIKETWLNPYYGSKPYLEAMLEMTTLAAGFKLDSGSYVINGFLANAQTWRGPKAREIKKELRQLLINKGK